MGAALALSATAKAQLPVSTAPENKNAVLEEFTGIYCGYCPDGHRRAQSFADNNPGDVVLINIHAGGYANPRSGDPDFRTPYGAAIASQSNLAGYPAGTINRREWPGMQQNSSGTAMSRGDWSTAGAMVMQEASYANLAVEGNMDVNADTLTVDVEMYFTGNGNNYVYLNAAVLQDNVIGPQSGRSGNPAQNTQDGQYIHQHMLRHMMTGQWGELITTTSQGTKISRTYKWAIPNDINGVTVVPEDLKVVAFVAEGRQNIVTGVKGPTGYLNNKENPIRSFAVYPNPAKDELHLNYMLQSSNKVSYSITDLSGKELMRNQIEAMNGTSSNTIDISNLRNGIYLISLEADGNRVTKRVSVAH